MTILSWSWDEATQIYLKLSSLKFLPLNYHHSYFLAATFYFTTFSYAYGCTFLQLYCFRVCSIAFWHAAYYCIHSVTLTLSYCTEILFIEIIELSDLFITLTSSLKFTLWHLGSSQAHNATINPSFKMI